MKDQKDGFNNDEYLEEYYIRPDEVEDYEDEEDESVCNLVIDTSRFNQHDDVVFEDGFIPPGDVEEYKITDFLIF